MVTDGFQIGDRFHPMPIPEVKELWHYSCYKAEIGLRHLTVLLRPIFRSLETQMEKIITLHQDLLSTANHLTYHSYNLHTAYTLQK
jgi:hypothetical protein